jgi:hypothetical protein
MAMHWPGVSAPFDGCSSEKGRKSQEICAYVKPTWRTMQETNAKVVFTAICTDITLFAL